MKKSITFADKVGLCSFILFNDKFSKGSLVKEFESRWATWLGVKYAVYVNSGSSANLILVDALKELHNLSDGDEVLVPACTWGTNISPLLQQNLKPVFCDINFENYSFDKDHLRRISETNNIKVIFVTHLLGLPSDVAVLKALFPEALIIEDCCESHGAKYQEKKVGTLGEGSTFSFYYGHHMTSIEGGMVCTDDYELYKLLLLKRSHGLARELPIQEYKEIAAKHDDIDSRFLFLTTGYNLRPTELNACLAMRQLKRLDSYIGNRRKTFGYYIERLSSDEVTTSQIELPLPSGNSSFCFPIVFRDHGAYEKFKALLDANSIEHRPVVGSNLTKQPFLDMDEIRQEDFPNANLLHHNGIYVGNNQFVTIKDVDLLVSLVRDALA